MPSPSAFNAESSKGMPLIILGIDIHYRYFIHELGLLIVKICSYLVRIL
jgi:hypothetical protein